MNINNQSFQQLLQNTDKHTQCELCYKYPYRYLIRHITATSGAGFPTTAL